MTRSEIIKKLLDRSTLSVKELTENLNVDRSNYYLWKTQKSIPKQSTINKLANMMDLKIVWTEPNNGTIQEKHSFPKIEFDSELSKTKDDLIRYQRDEIQKLKQENEKLKSNTVESLLFSEQEYDWSTSVDINISFKGVKRRIYDTENIGILAKQLKTTENQILPYFDIGEWHKMNKHPINKLITTQSLQNLESKTKLFTNIVTNFKNIGKFFTGDHYITIFVDYEFNNNVCRTICYCKIIETSKITILNKCKILHD